MTTQQTADAADDSGAARNIDQIKPAPTAAKAKKKRRTRKEQIAELEKQLQEAQEKILRQRAEFDNYRKRVQRDMSDIRELAKITTLEELLPVLDHFQMAMTAIDQSDDVAVIRQGMDMIHNEFNRRFENLGVERIPAVGEEFDPNIHEALKTEPSDEVREGLILSEFKAGYRIGERLLRAPAVIVSSGPAGDAKEDADETEAVAKEA